MGNIITNNKFYMFTHIFGQGVADHITGELRQAAQDSITKNGSVVEAQLESEITDKLQTLLPLAVAHLPFLIQPFALALVDAQLPNLVKLIVEDAIDWAVKQGLGSNAVVPAVDPVQ